MWTLDKILQNVFAEIALDASTPSDDELDVYVAHADRSVFDATFDNNFPEFRQIRTVDTSSYYGSLASIPLATYNFKEFEETPYIVNNESDNYPVIRTSELRNYDQGDKISYVLGNSRDGYHLIVQNLTEGEDLRLVFQRHASGFATLTDVCELSDPTYIVEDTKARLYKSFNDDRYNATKQEANDKLRNMVGRAQRYPVGGVNKTPSNFRNPLG